MLIIDDILLFPLTGIHWIFRQVHDAAQQELASEEGAITAKLSDAYMMLETNQITEAEFDAQEKALLDRLDRLQSPETSLEDETDEEREEIEEDFECATEAYPSKVATSDTAGRLL